MQTEHFFFFIYKGTTPTISVFFFFSNFTNFKQKGFKIWFLPVLTQGLPEAWRFKIPSLLNAHRLEGHFTGSNRKHLPNVDCLPGTVLNTLHRYTQRQCHSTILVVPFWVRKKPPSLLMGPGQMTLPCQAPLLISKTMVVTVSHSQGWLENEMRGHM